jgi:hypothetical protein
MSNFPGFVLCLKIPLRDAPAYLISRDFAPQLSFIRRMRRLPGRKP